MSSVIGTFQAKGHEGLLNGCDRPFGKVPKGFCGKVYLRSVRFATTTTIPVSIRARRGFGIAVLFPQKGVLVSLETDFY